jgi:hypothetical protein
MSTGPEEYALVVLGSGEAGKYLAWTLASQGQRPSAMAEWWSRARTGAVVRHIPILKETGRKALGHSLLRV